VRAADQPARFLHVLERLLRRQRLAHRFLRQVVQVRFEDVLRRGDHRQAHHRVLGHLVEQRVDRIALAGLAGEVPVPGGMRSRSVISTRCGMPSSTRPFATSERGWPKNSRWLKSRPLASSISPASSSVSG
jgi:hypothetical protein